MPAAEIVVVKPAPKRGQNVANPNIARISSEGISTELTSRARHEFGSPENHQQFRDVGLAKSLGMTDLRDRRRSIGLARDMQKTS